MLKKRIIPCLDIKNDQVVKGINFSNHEVIGDAVKLAEQYALQGADELVCYDITASSEKKIISHQIIKKIAENIRIPFCVAGGIKTIADAEKILAIGADKISINSPALENPFLIADLAKRFGTQCVVVGVDSLKQSDQFYVCQYTGSEKTMKITSRLLMDWIKMIQDYGAGEVVLNCMNQDGMRQGYDLEQFEMLKSIIKVPLIASGGAGTSLHFKQVLQLDWVSGALAASVFHKNLIEIPALKKYLFEENIEVRI